MTGIVVVDAEYTITNCNEAAADAFDVDRDAVVGEPLSTVVDPDAVDQEAGDEGRTLRRDGRTYEVQVEPFDARREHPDGYAIVFTDVTHETGPEGQADRRPDDLRLMTRLNEIIRGVNEVLVTRGTREGILEGATELLADSDLYDTGWAVEKTLVNTVPADDEADGPNADRARRTDGTAADGPDDSSAVEGSLADVRRALAVYDDAEELPVGEEVLEDVPEASEGRWTTVPVVHGRTAYGSIVLFSTREDAFGGRELAVLDELGQQIGHAVNAAEKELLLMSDTVTELELTASDDDPLAVASRIADCTLSVEGLIPVDGAGIVAYCSVEGTSIHEGFAALSRVDGIERLRPIDDSIVECQLGEGTLAAPLREVGAQLERVVAESGVCRVVARVSPEADVRAIVERVQRSVPAAELRAKHRRDDVPTEGGGGSLPKNLAENMTDRQMETLQAAFSAGYFEWPRESSAEDLADEMGVSSPTVHNHLRKAENAVLRELLDE